MIFDAESNMKVFVQLLDLTGQEVTNWRFLAEVGTNQQLLSLEDLPNGIYFLQLEYSGQVYIHKIVKF